jgi:hypothetical protein
MVSIITYEVAGAAFVNRNQVLGGGGNCGRYVKISQFF